MGTLPELKSLPQIDLDRSDISRWSWLTVTHLLERPSLELDKPALVFEGETRTYGELRDRARRVAHGLVDQGFEELDRVALLSANRLEFIEIEAGIAGARGIMVALNWRLRGRELANLLRHCQAKVAFVEDRFLETVEELRRAGETPDMRTVIGIPSGGDLSYEKLCASARAEAPPRQGRLEDPHEIIYTSGTTGAPKGVVWTNGSLIWSSLQQVMDFRIEPESSTYAVIDLYYMGGRHDFTWPILHQGGTAHIKRSGEWGGRAVVEYVAEHRITHILWVGTMLYDMLRVPDLGRYDTSCLRMIMCGGMPITAEITKQAQEAFPQTDFIQVYGLTEGGATATYISPKYAKSKPGSAGKATMHNRIRIVNDQGVECAPTEVGEIAISGPAVTIGYWDNPETTAQTLRDGWLYTGDMGYLDEEGFLYVSGRKKDMIISGGMNIFPVEIEDVLRTHPAVKDCAVIGVPDERWGERVCAVIEANEGAEVDEEEVIAYCHDRLASYKKPSFVREVEAMPRTMSQKPRKFLLREQFADLAQHPAGTSLPRR
jgi:fatty-acyl-CoA synthase